MSIHNQLALGPKQQPSAEALVQMGAHLPVEIHLHPVLEQHLQQQQPPTPVGRQNLIANPPVDSQIDWTAA